MKTEEMYHLLEHASLAVGYGHNRFTMSRGSFRYHRVHEWRRRTILSGYTENNNGFTLTFLDEKTGREYLLDVVQESDTFRLCVREDDPDVNRWWLILPSEAEEHFYGCGETYSKLDLKGVKVRIFVAEHQNTSRISRKLVREKISGVDPEKTGRFDLYESYYVQPTVVSSKKYYIHADSSRFAQFNFRHDEKTILHFQEKPDLVIVCKDSYEELAEDLSTRLGSYGKLPEWIYDGVILAVQEGCDAVDRRLQKALDAGVPVCGVWSQDWCGCRRTGFGYQVMWNWEADETLYPSLEEKIREWNEKGVHFLGYINPFMAIEKLLYAYAHEHGYCVKDKKGNDYLVTITTFPAAMIDFTNPEAYEWYKGLIKENMIGIGMSGWMADFGEYLPVDCVLYSGEDPEVLHNQWPAIWARMNREAIEECGKKDSVFCFMRAGYTGSIADCGMMWTGDQHVDWSVDDGIPSVITATLSLGMSGQALTHSDAGGYTTVMHMTRSKDLLERWEQMNAFSPLFRLHEGNQPSRNVQFDSDEELLAHLAKYGKIHQALKPYLLRLEEEAQKGLPVIRPLFWYYGGFEQETEEYLLGRDILVSPVLKQGETTHWVRFPDDVWTDLRTGKEYKAGIYTVRAPRGSIPVFVRKGHHVPVEVIEKLKEGMKES